MPITDVSSLLTDISACLQVTLEDAGVETPCYTGPVPGDGVVSNYAWECQDTEGTGCGVAWVRMITAYPAVGVGVPADGPDGCGTLVGVDLEIGIARCVSVADNNGEAPPKEDMMQAAATQADDMMLIRKAIKCCSSLDSQDYALGSYMPTGPGGGPGGGLVGGAWILSTVF